VAAVGLGAAGFSGRPPGFTLAGPENLMYSDIQRGAALVKPQLIAMCRGVPARPLTTPNDLDSAWDSAPFLLTPRLGEAAGDVAGGEVDVTAGCVGPRMRPGNWRLGQQS
jgi:hypothetical protein